MQLGMGPERISLSAPREVNLRHFALADPKKEVVSSLVSGNKPSGSSEEQVLGRHFPRKLYFQ
jgi:hypothetical protein